jgi:hypothetical protein
MGQNSPNPVTLIVERVQEKTFFATKRSLLLVRQICSINRIINLFDKYVGLIELSIYFDCNEDRGKMF